MKRNRNQKFGTRTPEPPRAESSGRSPGTLRLWRMRRRRDHIDATLGVAGDGWELTYLRNDKPMLAWRYAAESEARQDAAERRRELERAGWVFHW